MTCKLLRELDEEALSYYVEDKIYVWTSVSRFPLIPMSVLNGIGYSSCQFGWPQLTCREPHIHLVSTCGRILWLLRTQTASSLHAFNNLSSKIRGLQKDPSSSRRLCPGWSMEVPMLGYERWGCELKIPAGGLLEDLYRPKSAGHMGLQALRQVFRVIDANLVQLQ